MTLLPYFKQFQAGKGPAALRSLRPPGPVITLSHLAGTGAHEIGERLAGLLQTAEPNQPWKVFDRNLVEKVLADHHLPTDMAKYMPEDRRSLVQDVMEELVGLRPPSWVMIPRIAKTVTHLAGVGHVVLVGRGTSVITARMPNVFHVRVIASLPKRIERVQKADHLAPAEAARFIRKEDRARARYVMAHFHVRIENELLYDLIINTDRIADPAAARMIADAALKFFEAVEADSNTS